MVLSSIELHSKNTNLILGLLKLMLETLFCRFGIAQDLYDLLFTPLRGARCGE